MIHRIALPALMALSASICAASERGALSKMPIKEVTVFKDGHAFVLHEGTLPVGPGGDVALDVLPAPVLGTFWPYSAEKGAALRAVVAGERRVTLEKTPLRLAEFIEANPGAEVVVTEKPGGEKESPRYGATLLCVPERTGAEVEASLPPGSGLKLPEKGDVFLFKTPDGVKIVPVDRVQDVTLKGESRKSLGYEVLRPSLTLQMDWGGRSPASEARVGLAYLQKGLRWIPSYRVELDGKGGASVRLQGTLVNDLADLDNVTAHLVIGVPTFAFGDEVDPMALQKEAARLGGRMDSRSSMSSAFSNALVTQTAMNAGYMGTDEERASSGPEIAGGERAEDLFVFTVRGVTLRRGERMVLPVAEAAFRYRDMYTLEIPALPPPEVSGQRNLSGREAEVARQLASPKVMHKVRWTNSGKEPLTTAPALILLGGRPLAQGLMTYAAPGAMEELEITAAMDVPVRKSEVESKRTPDAVRWNNDSYTRVDLRGSVSLTNRRGEPVALEVTRRVLGEVDTASSGGIAKKLNPLSDGEASVPGWWSLYSWPYWWSHFNGLGKITWELTLEPGKSADIEYTWHYFWR